MTNTNPYRNVEVISVNMQTHDGVPFMFIAHMTTKGGKRYDNTFMCKDPETKRPLTKWFPLERLPENVKDFMFDSSVEMEWFGSSGDYGMYRFIKKAC